MCTHSQWADSVLVYSIYRRAAVHMSHIYSHSRHLIPHQKLLGETGFWPLYLSLYHYHEQKGYFWLVPEHAPGPSSQVLRGCRVRHPCYSKKLFVRYVYSLTVNTYVTCLLTDFCLLYLLTSSCTHVICLLTYRVAKTHEMPYLYRSFSAKEPYN